MSIAITFPSMRLLAGIMPSTDPPLEFATHPDVRMLAFTLVVSLLTATLFGLAPALQATRPDLAPTLKDQGNAVGGGGGQALWRRMLVCGQVSLSLLLLIAAGLFVRTLQNMKELSPGFEVSHLVSFTVDPTLSGYNTERTKIFFRELQEKLAATQG